MQMIRKYWAYLLLLFAVIFFFYKKNANSNEILQVKPFSIGSGWGYDILKNNKLFIHQDMIPAIEGKKLFINKSEALIVGEFVIYKIKKGIGAGLPQVTPQELDSLHITK